MNRWEATQAVGKRVRAWTALNGVYVGVLSGVIARQGSPWRGVVRIDGVVEVAKHFEEGQFKRRGHRPGEEIEIGAQSISVSDEPGAKTYEEALLNHIEQLRKEINAKQGTAEAAQLLAIGRGSQRALAAERVRLATGEWVLAGG